MCRRLRTWLVSSQVLGDARVGRIDYLLVSRGTTVSAKEGIPAETRERKNAGFSINNFAITKMGDFILPLSHKIRHQGESKLERSSKRIDNQRATENRNQNTYNAEDY